MYVTDIISATAKLHIFLKSALIFKKKNHQKPKIMYFMGVCGSLF